MWVLVAISLSIFVWYLVMTKNIINAVKSTIEKIIVSALLLIIVNIIINNYGLQVATNEYTVSIVGLLGLPGLGLVVLLQNVIFV